MNKIYVIFVMFAISGLLFATVPIPSHAASNLDYMLTIAEKAKPGASLKLKHERA